VSTAARHNVHVFGRGETDLVFAHGYGCDQNMWRLLTPAFEDRYRIIVYDLVGAGRSDLNAYDFKKYARLDAHADDLLEILHEHAHGRAIFVGHSVSAMIGMLASITEPQAFARQIMVGPSPCYVNDDHGYVGGFTRADIDGLLATLEENYLGWASAIAPVIMGAPHGSLGVELTNSFCRTDPSIAKHFARVTFTGDNRADLSRSTVPALLIQSSDDFIAPVSVGRYLEHHLPHSTLRVIENIGHCPHLSAPQLVADAMNAYLGT
jgi:sigma-B regulation protein RsbQ